jgi:predicted DNA-binding transcriptional regulator AlpA
MTTAHHNDSHDLDRVISVKDWSKRIGVSPKTGWRLVWKNKGPKITRLSENRIGIRERDHVAWLDARRIDAPKSAA